jgi:hypothetical protein
VKLVEKGQKDLGRPSLSSFPVQALGPEM